MCPHCHKSTLLRDYERIYCILCQYTVWLVGPTEPTSELATEPTYANVLQSQSMHIIGAHRSG